MATSSDLVDYVSDIIQDPSYLDAVILKYINRGLRQIAGGVFITYPDRTQVFSSPLPNLLTSSTVATSTTNPYVDLPDDFGRDLIAVISTNTGLYICIEDSYASFLNMYPSLNQSSSVLSAAVRGARLYYQGIPSTSDTLTLHYYSVPEELSGGSDTPDCLPSHLHEELLVNYAAMKIFDLIEDGIDGAKVNTQSYNAKFMNAMINLEMSIEDTPISVSIGSDYE